MDDQRVRADARRNRERVVQVAAQVFAAEGLSVPIAEIARRAGVGTGTVSRHFPTKEALFTAILAQRVQGLLERADALAAQEEPGAAFCAFFTAMVRAGAADRGFAERLAAAVGARTTPATVGADLLCERLGAFLEAAQRAGAVRTDITVGDVEALVLACTSRGQDGEALVAVVTDALAARRDR